ncbi:MAG: tetraacyldisaccharide 4'-kinase [Bacteroidales bacterium]|nr:tetraacyldisaccharide 4'-kinase [Bacteroidales bacterium]
MFKWLLFPFSIIYGFFVSMRNLFFDYNIIRSHEFDLPVINVGNITVGGTGKTPHVEYLVSLLKNQFNIATLSRGYKRDTNGFLIAHDKSPAKKIGDEPKQIKSKFPKITVAVDADRVDGIKKIIKKIKPSAIILDDAFQHRYVKSGLSILLVDYNKPIYEDKLLPYGRLRESYHEHKRADIIIVSKSPEPISPLEKRLFSKNLKLYPFQQLYFTKIKYKDLMSVYNSETSVSLNNCKAENYSFLLITGIANPKPLKKYLNKFSKNVQHIGFRDHHSFSKRNLEKIIKEFERIQNDKKIIITTEKDAMRLSELKNIDLFSKLPVFYLPIEIEFLNNEGDKFNKRIIDFIKNFNKMRI